MIRDRRRTCCLDVGKKLKKPLDLPWKNFEEMLKERDPHPRAGSAATSPEAEAKPNSVDAAI